MRCPKCGHNFKSPVAVAGGVAGGKARVAKGFSDPRVQAKAQATRKARAERSPNAPRDLRRDSRVTVHADVGTESKGGAG